MASSRTIFCPRRSRCSKALGVNASELLRHGTATTMEALGGFTLGSLLGVGAAILLASSRWLRQCFFPLALASQAVPIAAITPLIVLLIGRGLPSILTVVSIAAFFPMLINMTRGLREADVGYHELLHSLSATGTQRLRMIELPAALPYMFAALKVSASAAFITAIVGEWIGSNVGLGYLIVISGQYFKIPTLWAAVVVTGRADADRWSVSSRWRSGWRCPGFRGRSRREGPRSRHRLRRPVLALWWAVTALGWIDPLVLPSPIAVAAVFWNDAGTLAYNAGVTATEAVAGLVIGNTIGLLLAILFVGSPTSRRSVLPLAMAAQSVPIVAVTPALIIGFGNGMEPKILVAIFLVFFPMLVNGMRGLRSADAEASELLHSLSASSFQRLVDGAAAGGLALHLHGAEVLRLQLLRRRHRGRVGRGGSRARLPHRLHEFAVSQRRGLGGGHHRHAVEHGARRARGADRALGDAVGAPPGTTGMTVPPAIARLCRHLQPDVGGGRHAGPRGHHHGHRQYPPCRGAGLRLGLDRRASSAARRPRHLSRAGAGARDFPRLISPP